MVYRTRWGEWRTRVRGGRCVFLRDNVCTIHARAVLSGGLPRLPWTDAETGGPYEYDRTICPEFILRPELVQHPSARLTVQPPSAPPRAAHASGPPLRLLLLALLVTLGVPRAAGAEPTPRSSAPGSAPRRSR